MCASEILLHGRECKRERGETDRERKWELERKQGRENGDVGEKKRRKKSERK